MGWKLVSENQSLNRGRLVDLEWIAATAMIPVGTLRFGIDVTRNERRPFKIVDFCSNRDWFRSFVIYHNADGTISIEHKQGNERRYVRLSGMRCNAGRAQISYSWDAPKRTGSLAIECLETGAFAQASFADPFPLLAADAVELSVPGAHCRHDTALTSVSLADCQMPIGPAPSLGKGTLVMSDNGFRPVEALRLGDIIMTEQNGPQPIRWIVSEECPTVGATKPIRLRAPYFGLGRDVVLAASQQVQLPGAHPDYLLGKDRVLVEVGQLLAHPGAQFEDQHATHTQYQILLDMPDCINACGLWLESLYVGQLAEAKSLLAATRFAELTPEMMPRHRAPTCAPLSKYEAQTLIDEMVA